ncbi:polyadenylate-binding protein 1 [Arabidopsis thaliana]|uniref:Polyadenylate-binding protein 1 n=1 Tax=Arabidopsis thaliana TaxID=3702 RepID=F4KBV3_ARATH|nr:polyadenylate-binding protein 1 [Arabidopsis thaliana]AED96039.1 polyadenylate-binding protein 1 [Arabidopsis thaliana]|eukprot:NP_001190511.1 polyadenylate-binding protein 1 [Arabidopsis thaliana]
MPVHDEQEHEVYGGEIPEEEEGEMDTEEYEEHGGEEGAAAGDEELEPGSSSRDLEDMKKRIKEIEEEAGALREMQAKAEKDMGASQGLKLVLLIMILLWVYILESFSESMNLSRNLLEFEYEKEIINSGVSAAEKEEVDSRSIYVGNVDYACTPEEVQQHFQSCGTVNRVTILTDKFGQPKGFAYVEFVEVEAVQNSLILNESELHGRQIKVSAKRTNVPGMRQFRGRGRPFRPMRGFMPGVPFYPPYAYGRVPRFRRPMRYRPY